MFWKKKRDKIICPKCGKEHTRLPAIGFDAPHYYNILSNDDKEELAELDDDFCVITYPDQTDRFIRTYLRLLIFNACEDLDYGVWASVSKQTFDEYQSEFKSNKSGKSYFGTLSNEISDYVESTLGLHVNIETHSNGIRPELYPHQAEHILVKEWENGIRLQEAMKRIDLLMRNKG